MKLTENKLLRAIGEADEQMVEKAAPKLLPADLETLRDFVPEQTETPTPQRGRIIRRITEIGVLCAAVALCVFAGIGLVKLKRSVQKNKTVPSVQRAQAVLEEFLDAANSGDTEKMFDLSDIRNYAEGEPLYLTEDTFVQVYPFFLPNVPEEEKIINDMDYPDVSDYIAMKSELRDAIEEECATALKYESWKILSGKYASDELEIRQKRLADRRDLQVFRFRENGEEKLAERELVRTNEALRLLGMNQTVYTFEVSWLKDGEQITDTIDVYYYVDSYVDGEEFWEVQPFDIDAEPLTDAEQQELDAYRARQEASGESLLKFRVYADHAELESCDATARSVTIPAEYQGLPVTGIFNSSDAFWDCYNLTEITFEDNHGQFDAVAFECTPWLQKQEKDDPMVICGDTLVNARNVTDKKAVIPDGVRYISKKAFYLIPITSVVIPDSVVSIGTHAFAGTELSEVSIAESVTDFGVGAFDYTPWIKAQRENHSPLIVNSVLVDAKACTGRLEIPDTVTKIAGGAFMNSKITELTLPRSVTEIGEDAFKSMTNLQKITIPDGLITKIPTYAFSYTSLESITIPDGIAVIGDNAFNSCSALTTVTIPDSVTAIDRQAFMDCEQLHDVYIPDSVNFIGDFAFDNCSQLTIHGKAGSYAETYAKERDIPFVAE